MNLDPYVKYQNKFQTEKKPTYKKLKSHKYKKNADGVLYNPSLRA